ncbi:hypothetical protein GQ651_00130 [Alphaproteobacteria bacterium GH1-50]|uniref:Peptidase S74 domain-containing protein n=1 Tax=Kangsaoukella pontilimi TaxID=2691042 RepID=A0A7C9J0M1_9RHOB|nr:tail fiber domain-containing protein [Kangsaoukella pontilimi]MXQ06241.1 hypothetical protein [Kangsaoukella pontilimi]
MRALLIVVISTVLMLLAACATERDAEPEPSADTVAAEAASTDVSEPSEEESGIYDMHPVAQVVLGVVAGVALFAGLVIYAVASASDERLKTDIRRVGTAPNGLPLYTFRYRGKRTTWRGVMAQDVLRIRPDAVRLGRDGYYRVYYWKLGLRMTRENLAKREGRKNA